MANKSVGVFLFLNGLSTYLVPYIHPAGRRTLSADLKERNRTGPADHVSALSAPAVTVLATRGAREFRKPEGGLEGSGVPGSKGGVMFESNDLLPPNDVQISQNGFI